MKRGKKRKMLGRITGIGMVAALLAGGQAMAAASATGSDTLQAEALPLLAEQVQAELVMEELRLQVGSAKATLNGEEWTIAKPYLKQGVTMVPLRVFTKTFGAELSWCAGNVVTLRNDNTALRLRVGQPQAMANGRAVTLPIAPEMVNGTLMVPLQPLTEAFGATYTVENDQRIILERTGTLADAVIDVSAKAERIGDHVRRWSMVLPQGWSYRFLTPEENAVVIESPSGQARAEIYINSWQSNKLAHLADQFAGETTGKQMLEHMKTEMFDKDAIMSSHIGTIDGKAYAQAFVHDESLRLTRVFSAGGNRYTVMISDDTAASARQLLQYEPLLNTFRPNDVPANRAGVIDISTEIDGFRTTALWGDGLLIDIPATWEQDPDENRLYAPADQGQLLLEYYSLRADTGATPASLIRQEEALMKKMFRPEYRQTVGVQDVTLKSGQQAKLLTEKYRYHKQDWFVSKTLIVLDEGVQFVVQYCGPDRPDAVQLGERMVESVRVDGRAKEQLDDLEAWDNGSELWVPWTKTVERRSTTWGLQMEIPKWWLGYRGGSATEELETKSEAGAIAAYLLPGSSFMLHVNHVATVEEAMADWRKLLPEVDPSIRFVKEETQIWRGRTAMRVQLTGLTTDKNIGNIPYTTDMLLIAKDGYVYTLCYETIDASRTTEILEQFEQVVDSFRFTP